MVAPAIVWFRRDLRLRDHPALLTASRRTERALAVFVLDARLLTPAGSPRRTFLYRCLRTLDTQLDGRLLVLEGRPDVVLPDLARRVGAGSVHVSAETDPYGYQRDEQVGRALEEVGAELVPTGSPYAVTPGRITKSDGDPYRVFTPFRRAWGAHGWPLPAATDRSVVEWMNIADLGGVAVPDDEPLGSVTLPPAGEEHALERWQEFFHNGLGEYHQQRDRPDRPSTSRMSVYLHWGCVHPRTLLADLADSDSHGASSYRNELAFRDFYADVVWNWPDSARRNFDRRFNHMRLDTDSDAWGRFDAWCRGRTGFPIVDAGMRQLLTEGWMHNRVRMIVASFLVKDLHLPWWWGARYFMRHLVDGDLASNQHGWQWAAGTGTDAAPYFRIFNPTTQGEKFDPDGDYVRSYVPELRDIGGGAVHRPWKTSSARVLHYPGAIVDHAHERQEALARYGEIKQS